MSQIPWMEEVRSLGGEDYQSILNISGMMTLKDLQDAAAKHFPDVSPNRLVVDSMIVGRDTLRSRITLLPEEDKPTTQTA